MSVAEKRMKPQLVMHRPSLENLEPVVLPEGFVLRHFREGDEPAWEHIIAESFEQRNNPNRFDTLMRGDPQFRPERIWFILAPHGRPVATASAWRKPGFGSNTGYVHMVGTLPAHRGKRLGYWTSLAALHQFVAEGRTAAILQTDDDRLAAIKTYLHLEFEPYLVHENQRERWNQILPMLDSAVGSTAGEWTTRFVSFLSSEIRSVGE